ncbi:hypothetical protein NC653_003286 [Populus alba x Populus x berolinensis]|uniref:Uncharacterized protein n=1 Tax=Populus alba x Populus x berolinensis TaxID=444605 RepID=A0AAD6WIY7_9ROSI|nr:hypothetical protein NC653_003286 [Populus alba x Populus x berolinensis]
MLMVSMEGSICCLLCGTQNQVPARHLCKKNRVLGLSFFSLLDLMMMD